MIKITVKGQAKTSYSPKKDLHGVSDDSDFVEYMHNENVKNKLKEGAYLEFKFEGNRLMSVVEYISKVELTESELEYIKDYTQGQWSDGIGEGFEQNPVYINDKEVYISPWFNTQEVEITQVITVD